MGWYEGGKYWILKQQIGDSLLLFIVDVSGWLYLNMCIQNIHKHLHKHTPTTLCFCVCGNQLWAKALRKITRSSTGTFGFSQSPHTQLSVFPPYPSHHTHTLHRNVQIRRQGPTLSLSPPVSHSKRLPSPSPRFTLLDLSASILFPLSVSLTMKAMPENNNDWTNVIV